MRFRIESGDHCADRIWRELLKPGADQQAVLTARQLSFGPQRMFASDGEQLASPSDWFIIYAVAQALVQPEFCGGKVALEKIPLADFRRDIIANVTARSPLGKMKVRATLNVNPTQSEMSSLQETLGRHGPLIRQAVTDIVNAWRRRHRGGERPIELFDRSDLRGVEAIARLRAALIEGLVPAVVPYDALVEKLDRPGWLEKPKGFGKRRFEFVYTDGDARSKAINAFCDYAFLPGSKFQLINGHASSLRGGLTAFASELFKPHHRADRHCKLPMLYIPLHGRTPKPPRDSFAALAFEIWTFYARIHKKRRIKGEPKSDLDRKYGYPRSLDQAVAVLRSTHRLMAEYPAIVLFDGYRAPRYEPETRDYSLPNLTAAIAGDRLFDLIERLVLIPSPDPAGPIDVDRFQRNRFIILSEEPLYSSDAGDGIAPPLHPHPATRLISGVSVAIPPPHPSRLPEILGSFGNQHPDQIGWLLRNVAQQTHIDTAQLDNAYEAHTQRLQELTQGGPISRLTVSESLVGVLSAIEEYGVKIPTQFAADRTSHAVRKLIEEVLWPSLEQRLPAAEPVMLHLIAIAPGGLRPKTLARVYEHFLDALHGGESPITREQINGRIETMLVRCHGLVNVLRSDGLEAISGRPVPILFRRGFGFGRGEIDCDRAIEFAFDEVRQIVLRQPFIRREDGTPDPRYLPFLHLLLAEEAYEQFTHLARYDPLQDEESLQRKSRLLTALYHGAASLGDGDFSIAPLYRANSQFLPDNPRDRWVKLYSSAYRENLDHDPQHDLMRRFDAAQTKLDILLALARPQLVRAAEIPSAQWTLPRLAEGPSRVPEQVRQSILGEFALDLRRASHAVSRQLDVDWPPIGLTRDPYSERLADFTEKALTLTDDPRVRDEDVDELSSDILAEISALLELTDAQRGLVRRHLEIVGQHVDRVLRGVGKGFIPVWLEERILERAAVPVEKVKPLIDYLSLYGEVLGVKADRDYGDEIARRDQAPMEAPRSDGFDEPSPAVRAGFVQSFSAYYVAEFLRNRIYWGDPNHGPSEIGGRAARGYIRVALKLERFRVSLARHHEADPKPGGWFWQRAHLVSDEFARQLSRFPRERVSNLILDSTMARYYESRHSDRYAKFLEMACECLRSAEPQVMKLSMHNRLRQRFALERTKVLAEKARLAIKACEFEQAYRYLAICVSDIDSFERIARPDDLLWKNLAASNRSRIEKLKMQMEAAKLALRPPELGGATAPASASAPVV